MTATALPAPQSPATAVLHPRPPLALRGLALTAGGVQFAVPGTPVVGLGVAAAGWCSRRP
ncbi:hypothetical protein [Geodermatophilus sp. SYSU D01105]